MLVSMMLAGCLGGSDSDEPDALPALPGILAPGEETSFAVDADRAVWRIQDQAIEGTSVSHTFNESGLFVVDVEMLHGGLLEDEARIQPVGVASEEPLAIATEETAVGTRWTINLEADAYAWDFGDGNVARERSVVHVHDGPATVTAYALVGDTVHQASVQVDGADAPTWRTSHVGASSFEPTVATTSDGCIFFVAGASMMRSCDAGASWTDTTGPLTSPPDLIAPDPLVHVEPVTDRVFSAHLIDFATCIWVGWSDDGGDSWLGNPLACKVPNQFDHEKMTSGPWTAAGLDLNPVYPRAVYLCYNKGGAGSWCMLSLDGGMTYPIETFVGTSDNLNRVIDPGVDVGGLHGPIVTGPDGSVYLPHMHSTPKLSISRDNSLTWKQVEWADDLEYDIEYGDPEVAVDAANHVYYVRRTADSQLHLWRSEDAGETWPDESIIITDQVRSAVHPTMVAGDDGRIAIAYYGSPDTDISGSFAPDHARWYTYVTYSLNAMDPEPDFHTVRLTDDPVQRGPLAVSLWIQDDYDDGDPVTPPTNTNNLGDFMGIHMDLQGRVYVAFADGCTGTCATDLLAAPYTSRDSEGVLGLLVDGPGLLESPLQPV